MTALRTDAPMPVDPRAAEHFVRMFHDAHPAAGPAGKRLAAVRESIEQTGTYRHTVDELSYGARVALRDSGWVLARQRRGRTRSEATPERRKTRSEATLERGRTKGEAAPERGSVAWRQLKVRDLRGLRNAAAVAAECVAHLRLAYADGDIKPLCTVFAPDTPTTPGPRIWNDQLVRYAGHRTGNAVIGDRRYADFTDTVTGMGWQRPGAPSRFDVLPLVIATAHEGVRLFDVPADAAVDVPLSHPDLPWFAELGLRWPAVPVVANMTLTIGGVRYPAAPVNSWHIGTDIGTRGLADETAYGVAGEVARRLGLDVSSERTLWRDRVTVELNRAVLHSFDTAGVTITDHHAEARQRLAWLRSRQRPDAYRPAFRVRRDPPTPLPTSPDGAVTGDSNGDMRLIGA